MKVRSNEARWIQVKKTGNYRWQINVTNGDGIRKTFADSTPGKKGKLACERKADEWLLKGSPTKGRRTQEVFDDFIKNLKDKNTSESYYRPYESFGENWIKPHIGLKRITSLTVQDLENIILDAYKSGLSHKTLCHIRSCVMTFLKFARKSNETTLNPEEIEIPKGAPRAEKFTLEEEEVKVLLSSTATSYKGAVVEEWFIHAFRFQVLMGYRPGELAGLQTCDVSGDTISLERGIAENGKITGLKNRNAKRQKKMNDLARKELDAQKEMLKRAGIVTKWLFPGPDGNALVHYTYREHFQRYLKYNGIGKRTLSDESERYLTPYELRHTWVSLNDEMPEGLKKKAVGWSEKFDGDRVYGHELSGDTDKIASFENERFSKLMK